MFVVIVILLVSIAVVLIWPRSATIAPVQPVEVTTSEVVPVQTIPDSNRVTVEYSVQPVMK